MAANLALLRLYTALGWARTALGHYAEAHAVVQEALAIARHKSDSDTANCRETLAADRPGVKGTMPRPGSCWKSYVADYRQYQGRPRCWAGYWRFWVSRSCKLGQARQG